MVNEAELLLPMCRFCKQNLYHSLIAAAGHGNHECVAVLVANLESAPSVYQHVLELAILRGHYKCIPILLAHGADVNMASEVR